MAKQQSLASQQQPENLPAQVGDFQLPAIFGENAAVEVMPRFTVPYLSFSQPAAKAQWAEFLRKFPDIEDGDPVLVYPDGNMIRPQPLNLTICTAKQFYAVRAKDKGGQELERYSKKADALAALKGDKNKDVVERIWAALIVYLPTEALPCTCMFKSVKCNAAQKISDEIRKSESPDWREQGADFDLAFTQCKTPFSRVVGLVTISGKTGKESGQSYRETKATVRPSNLKDWRLLAHLLTEEGMSKMRAVADAYSNRLAELCIK